MLTRSGQAVLSGPCVSMQESKAEEAGMRYLVVYHGESAENEEERKAGIQMMRSWYGRLGRALADGGAPFTRASTVSASGAKDGPIGPMPTGYSILEAASLAEATELVKGCPLLQHGREAVVYETLA
jgi:hypothetical protein